MTNIINLAKQAGLGWAEGLGDMIEFLLRFHDLAIETYRKRLLEGVGEPVGEAYLCDACDTPFDGGYYCPSKTCGHNTSTKQPVYTADQLAAAVAREREECAKVCEQWGAWNNVAQDCAAAIRARK